MSRLVCVAYDLLACAQPDPDPAALIATLHEASELLGTDVRGELAVPFQPHGSTCVLVLSESHLIVSTWPEHRLAHVDLITCRADTPPDQALKPILRLLAPQVVKSHHIDRRLTTAPPLLPAKAHPTSVRP
ncbi:S-adenosylmethionine decarboxylase family protein [Streptomyces sp. NBC_01803]|uniref:S-adenosylmethionine decarboxylase family protein n=1 Tax=Streptomyces sp. NBC_01803 TaxID=2975946 RepID=UPI002DDA05ED|nr:S-adenosylmethionine decarboxylase [Streptomyces sp. NBC_01803]WSA43526.1 S-adenosylmethionine decarboxylase [Streptomyces sp. NBC_01803]